MELFVNKPRLETATSKQRATALFSVILLIRGPEAEECLLSQREFETTFCYFHPVPGLQTHSHMTA